LKLKVILFVVAVVLGTVVAVGMLIATVNAVEGLDGWCGRHTAILVSLVIALVFSSALAFCAGSVQRDGNITWLVSRMDVVERAAFEALLKQSLEGENK